MASEKEIGKVSSYFKHVDVAAVELSGKLKVGARIHIRGHTSDFEQEVGSMQIDRKEVGQANAGDHVGIKVEDAVRPNDRVFLVKE